MAWRAGSGPATGVGGEALRRFEPCEDLDRRARSLGESACQAQGPRPSALQPELTCGSPGFAPAFHKQNYNTRKTTHIP